MVKAQKPAVPLALIAWNLTFGKATEIKRVPQHGIHGSTGMEAAIWGAAVRTILVVVG